MMKTNKFLSDKNLVNKKNCVLNIQLIVYLLSSTDLISCFMQIFCTSYFYNRVMMELISRVSEKKRRVALMTSAPLPPDALKNAIKSHNFFRAKWR